MVRKGRRCDGDMLSSVTPEKTMVRIMQVTGQVWVTLGQRPWNKQVWYVAPVAKAQRTHSPHVGPLLSACW